MAAHAADAHGHDDHHHGPPAANVSSRVDARVLGMLMFIGSEIMLFGSFFTAYFFIRVVNHDPWPNPGDNLPVFVAGINTFVIETTAGRVIFNQIWPKALGFFNKAAGKKQLSDIIWRCYQVAGPQSTLIPTRRLSSRK